VSATASRERILLIRTSALGDVVHCLPVLTALRRHRPQAHIGWIVEEAMAPLLAGHPDLDEILPVRLRPWRHELLTARAYTEMTSFLGRLQAFAADIAIDLMGNHKAAALAALSQADRRIGAAWDDRREPSSGIWINQPVVPQGHHVVDRALSLLTALDIPAEPPDFGADKLLADLPIAAAELLDSRTAPFFVIHPGAGWGNKRYPPERWGEVARLLMETSWISTLVVAGPGEIDLAQQVEAASQGAAQAVDAPTLPFLAALLRRAVLVLAGDTGPMHLARALEAPVLAVMGPTDPATHGPYARPSQALAHRLPCSFCHQRLEGPRACLLGIEPQEVAAAATARL